MKLYCGLDIHKKFHVDCIMDEKGKIVKEGKFENSKDGIDGFFSGFGWRIARISTARYMLTIVYAMLNQMQLYVP